MKLKKEKKKLIGNDKARALVTKNMGRSKTRNSKGRGKFEVS